jgi:hypothetical protein
VIDMKTTTDNTRLEIQTRYWREWSTQPDWGYWHPLRPNLRYNYEEGNIAPVLEKMQARIEKTTAKTPQAERGKMQYRIVKIREIRIVEELS